MVKKAMNRLLTRAAQKPVRMPRGLFQHPASAAAALLALACGLSADTGGWERVLSSIGLAPGETIHVTPPVTAATVKEWAARIERGAFVILEGDSPLAAAMGIRRTNRRVVVRSVEESRAPKLQVVWERALDLPAWELPAHARVFTKERWEAAPLVAGFRHGAGGVLWTAAPPGESGYERFPYLAQALVELGVEPPLQARRLWAFFDASYRSRVDLDYFAERWRRAGIAALHVASWHFFEPDAERDAYLRRLIEACHKRAILVYAWIELPHVSEKFWHDHPEWREKTALLQDAHLDWRRLMNLQNRDCRKAAAAGLRDLAARFDWDGLNLAELYFESLEGHGNASRFTPMNDDVRAEFRGLHGFDPIEIFDPAGPRHHSRDERSVRQLLDFRADLARRMQAEWIVELEEIRASRRHLDLVLTHVDDRFDTRMRDLIGADAARLLPLLVHHDFTFLIEDPATVWHLGPERYPRIAARYEPITPRRDRLAIDINIVERYQDVYPTKQQTGVEFFRLIQLAARAFPRVALYFENSIAAPDLGLLPAAQAVATRFERRAGKLVVESPNGVGVAWKGPALVDGAPWPAANDSTVWLPAGLHAVEPGERAAPVRLLDFNGELRSAAVTGAGIEFAYRSSSRALAIVDRAPARIAIDGETTAAKLLESAGTFAIVLPRGQHVVAVEP
jgi:hypothetical protein